MNTDVLFICVFFNFIQEHFFLFSVYKSSNSLVKFIPKNYFLFDYIKNQIVFFSFLQKDPLWPTSQNIGNKSKINKLDLIKIKSFSTTKNKLYS